MSEVKVNIPDIGDVNVYISSANSIGVRGHLSLLWDGRLYSFDGRMGRHGDDFYLVSGATLSGQTGQKTPKRVDDPVSESVTAAVNAFLKEHPEYIAEAEEKFRIGEIKRLKDEMKRKVSYRTELEQGIEKLRSELRKYGEDA